ncbi:calcium-dependent phosphotriesterase superfamily protein [Artemisia annua]|uniref:Calcium-dependent phosphotriesterase superfamily protein n=1 Tax=Artemisia annua TaxID=35608 RepID=A0A2U1PEE1_ARTAN|nr:calcium-dependent phosphotriesterase superfamily protein [Artemisia annua]
MASFFCSTKFFFLLFLISAIPIAIIVSLESTTPTTNYYQFHSTGWFRESSKWDDVNNRFIVSFTDTGGLGVVNVPKGHKSEDVLEETCRGSAPEKHAGLMLYNIKMKGWLLYHPCILETKSNLICELDTGGGKSFADDVTVDAEGNAYVTDAKGTQIWKVSVDGQLLSTIKSPLFHAKEWYNDIITLNGIVYHPNGYIIVAHTITGKLFKVEINNDNKVTEVKLEGKLKIADGLELLSPTKLVVAGANGVKLVESNDDWITASLIGRSPVLTHRVATAAMVKDGKVYINHALGMGFPKKKHVFVEAAFS